MSNFQSDKLWKDLTDEEREIALFPYISQIQKAVIHIDKNLFGTEIDDYIQEEFQDTFIGLSNTEHYLWEALYDANKRKPDDYTESWSLIQPQQYDLLPVMEMSKTFERSAVVSGSSDWRYFFRYNRRHRDSGLSESWVAGQRSGYSDQHKWMEFANPLHLSTIQRIVGFLLKQGYERRR